MSVTSSQKDEKPPSSKSDPNCYLQELSKSLNTEGEKVLEYSRGPEPSRIELTIKEKVVITGILYSAVVISTILTGIFWDRY